MKKRIIKNQPLVSVIMPVYNAGDYLVDAVESILRQTYTNFELIIVDDCSTDGSSNILRAYKRNYPKRITLIRMKKNLNGGGDHCANAGIQVAKGKYIARMDADDIAAPTRLTKQVAYLESHKQVFLVGSNATVIDTLGKTIGDKLEPLSSEAIYKAYFTFHPLIHPSVMFHRIYNDEMFQYKIKYSANNDYYTFFTLLCKGYQFANLEEKLIHYRIHGTNDTFKKMKHKFLNTLRIRGKMVIQNGYKFTPKDALTTTCQAVVMFSLPERVSTKLYLVSKGIIKKEELLAFLHKPKLSLTFLEAR